MKNKALVVIDLQNDITKNYKEIIGLITESCGMNGRQEGEQDSEQV